MFTQNQIELFNFMLIYSFVLIYYNYVISTNFLSINFYHLFRSEIYFLLIAIALYFLGITFYYSNLDYKDRQKIYFSIFILTLNNLIDFIFILFRSTRKIISNNFNKQIENSIQNNQDKTDTNTKEIIKESNKNDQKLKLDMKNEKENITKSKINSSPTNSSPTNSISNFNSNKKLSDQCINEIRMILSDVDERTIRLLVRKINTYL